MAAQPVKRVKTARLKKKKSTGNNYAFVQSEACSEYPFFYQRTRIVTVLFKSART